MIRIKKDENDDNKDDDDVVSRRDYLLTLSSGEGRDYLTARPRPVLGQNKKSLSFQKIIVVV